MISRNALGLAAAFLIVSDTGFAAGTFIRQTKMTFHDALVNIFQTQRPRIIALNRTVLNRFAQHEYVTESDQRKLNRLAQELQATGHLIGIEPENLTLSDPTHTELLETAALQVQETVAQEAELLRKDIRTAPSTDHKAQAHQYFVTQLLHDDSVTLSEYQKQYFMSALPEIQSYRRAFAELARLRELEEQENLRFNEKLQAEIRSQGATAKPVISPDLIYPTLSPDVHHIPKKLPPFPVALVQADLRKTTNESQFADIAASALELFDMRLDDAFPEGGLWPGSEPHARFASFEKEYDLMIGLIEKMSAKRGYKSQLDPKRLSQLKGRLAAIKNRLPPLKT